MFTVLRQHNFFLFWLGQLISVIGDRVLLVALPIYVFEQTGLVLETGMMFMALVLPRLLFGSVAGVFVDHWDRRWTMIVTDVCRAVLLLSLLIVSLPEGLRVIYVVAFAMASLSQFFEPTREAVIPQLVGEENLVPANSLQSISRALTFLIGPLLGGILMESLGLTSVVLIDSTSFLISALLIYFISISANATGRSSASPKPALITSRAVIWQSWLDGLHLVKKESWMTTLFIAIGLAAFAQGIVTVLFVIFVKEVLKGGALEFGWLVAVQGVGGLLGGFTVGLVGRALQPARLIALSELVVGLIFLMMFSFSSLLLALALSAILAIPATGFNVGIQTLIQNKVVGYYQGRIFGVRATTEALLMLGGTAVATILGDMFGAQLLLQGAAGVFFLAGVVVLGLRPYSETGQSTT